MKLVPFFCNTIVPDVAFTVVPPPETVNPFLIVAVPSSRTDNEEEAFEFCTKNDVVADVAPDP